MSTLSRIQVSDAIELQIDSCCCSCHHGNKLVRLRVLNYHEGVGRPPAVDVH